MKTLTQFAVLMIAAFTLSGCLSYIPKFYENDRNAQQQMLDQWNSKYTDQLDAKQDDKDDGRGK